MLKDLNTVYGAPQERTSIQVFYSIYDLYEAVKTKSALPPIDLVFNSVNDDDDGGFNSHGMTDTLKILSLGGHWPEGVQAITKVYREIDNLFPTSVKTFQKNFAGSHPCVPSACAGSARSMFSRNKKKVALKKHIKLGIYASTLGDCTATQVFNRGGAILSYIDHLVNQGYTLELWAINHAQTGALSHCVETLIKPAKAILNASMLSFAFCASSFQRRAIFCLRERDEIASALCANGYGSTPKADQVILTAADGEDYDLVIPKLEGSQAKKPGTAFLELDSFFSHVLEGSE